MMGRPSRLRAGCQLRLVWWLGQTTWWASESMQKAGQVERVVVAGLPAGVGRQRTDSSTPWSSSAGKDLPDAGGAGVDQVDVGQQVHDGEVWVPIGHGVQVGGGGVGGGHVGDQVGPVGRAALGEVGLVAAPVTAALDAGPSVEVVGLRIIRLPAGRSRQRTWPPSR
jgi:hypothetical protein